MRVVILENSEQVSQRAADMICRLVKSRPRAILGLATGSSPLGTYRKIIERVNKSHDTFSQVTCFNLDEYVGLSPDHEQSYRRFMRENLFAAAGFDLSQCHIPDGSAGDLHAACEAYEQDISRAGGIDLQLLGIGTDGHIGFNEPGSSLSSRTRVKALAEQTRKDNARFFESEDLVPRLAITMGVGTILDARHVVLIATGQKKANAVRAFIEGPVTAQVPASALQLHQQTTVLLDEEAASWLTRSSYYRYVEKLQSELESQGELCL
jgi:glucosamine-6-phosphate deaminase